MLSELVCLERLIGQTEEIGAELVAKGEETARPGSKDRGRNSVALAINSPIKNNAADCRFD